MFTLSFGRMAKQTQCAVRHDKETPHIIIQCNHFKTIRPNFIMIIYAPGRLIKYFVTSKLHWLSWFTGAASTPQGQQFKTIRPKFIMIIYASGMLIKYFVNHKITLNFVIYWRLKHVLKITLNFVIYGPPASTPHAHRKHASRAIFVSLKITLKFVIYGRSKHAARAMWL